MDLNQVTAEALKEVIDTIKDSKSFVVKQAPDLAQEIILEAKVSALYNLLVSLFFLAVTGSYLFSLTHVEGEIKGYQFGLMVASIIVGIISSFGFLCTIESIISLITAPKMFILKQLSKAVSKGE